MTEVKVYDVVRLRRNPGLADATDVAKDFELRATGALPLSGLENPMVSLYSLDLEQSSVVFVEAVESKHLAAEPFMYMAQRKRARRVLTIDFDTFFNLYSASPLPSRQLLQLYSVGRCGSTLLHHALNQIPGVTSLSEPDVLYQIALWIKTARIKTDIADRCAGAALRCLWRQRPAGTEVLAIKHRGKGIWAFREFLEACPGARTVFLYRNAVDTIQSFDRAAGSPHGRRQWLFRVPILASFSRYAFRVTAARYGVDIYQEHLRKGTATDIVAQGGVAGYLLLDWISKVDCYLQLRERDPDSCALRYEDLVTAPEATLEALLAACGLPAGDLTRLAAVFAKDAQEGTTLMRSGSNAHPLNATTISMIHAIVSEHTRLPADGVLPGTLRVMT